MEDIGELHDEGGAGKLFPIISHQESKNLDGEPHIITVFDKTEEGLYQLEAFSLSSSETIKCKYSYHEFNAIFRFNAELMNPNKKKQRWHWIFDRLVFQSDGRGGRKLNIHFEPTEQSQDPILLRQKIPIGKMDYTERQRLRDEMDRLDIKRTENITQRRKLFLDNFIKGVQEKKKLMRLKTEEREKRIAKDRETRVESKLEVMRLEEVERQKVQARHEARLATIEVKEKVRREKQLKQTRELLAKQKTEGDKKVADRNKENEERNERRKSEKEAAEEYEKQQKQLNAKRNQHAVFRDERIKKKTLLLIMEDMEKHAEHNRWIQSLEETKKNMNHEDWSKRSKLWEAVKKRQTEIDEGNCLLTPRKDVPQPVEEKKEETEKREEGVAVVREEKPPPPLPEASDDGAAAKPPTPEAESKKGKAKKKKKTENSEEILSAMDVVVQRTQERIQMESVRAALDEKRNAVFREDRERRNAKEVMKSRTLKDESTKERLKMQEKALRRQLANEENVMTAKMRREAKIMGVKKLNELRAEKITEREKARQNFIDE